MSIIASGPPNFFGRIADYLGAKREPKDVVLAQPEFVARYTQNQRLVYPLRLPFWHASRSRGFKQPGSRLLLSYNGSDAEVPG